MRFGPIATIACFMVVFAFFPVHAQQTVDWISSTPSEASGSLGASTVTAKVVGTIGPPQEFVGISTGDFASPGPWSAPQGALPETAEGVVFRRSTGFNMLLFTLSPPVESPLLYIEGIPSSGRTEIACNNNVSIVSASSNITLSLILGIPPSWAFQAPATSELDGVFRLGGTVSSFYILAESGVGDVSYTLAEVPEPSALVAAMVPMLFFTGRRRRRTAA